MSYGWQIASGKDLDRWVNAFNLIPRFRGETDAEVRARVDCFARDLPHQPKAPQDMNLRELFDHVAIVADAVRAALLTHPGMTPPKSEGV